MVAAPSGDALIACIRRLWREGGADVFLVRHLHRRSKKREVSTLIISRVIDTGRLAGEPEWDKDWENWKVTLVGVTVDGEEVGVGLAVDLIGERLWVITAFWR